MVARTALETEPPDEPPEDTGAGGVGEEQGVPITVAVMLVGKKLPLLQLLTSKVVPPLYVAPVIVTTAPLSTTTVHGPPVTKFLVGETLEEYQRVLVPVTVFKFSVESP